MYALLLAIIYVAFISLGLPDSLLGSAWPVMYGELGVTLSSAGVITIITTIKGGKWTCASITAKVTGDRVIRNQEGEFVEATFIKFLR